MEKKDKKILFFSLSGLGIILSVLIFLRLLYIGQAIYFSYVLVFDVLALMMGISFFVSGKEKTINLFFNAKTGALILIAIPVLISFQKVSGDVVKTMGVIRWTEEFSTSIRPSLRSTLFGIMLITSILVRNGNKNIKGILSYLIIAFDIMFVSSFLNILCTNDPWPIPFLTIDNQTFLIFAILISWVGISAVSGIMWIVVFILGITELTKIESAMGFVAVVYLICAFLSILAQLTFFKINFSFKEEFMNKAAKKIKGDISATGKVINNIANPVSTVLPEIEDKE